MSYTSPSGKVYDLVPLDTAKHSSDWCGPCAFEPADSNCLGAPDCTDRSVNPAKFKVFVEQPTEEDDFLSGVTACGIVDGPCESCQ